MPTRPLEYVPQPFVRSQFVPSTATLGDALRRRGDLQAQMALARGQGTVNVWGGLAQAFAQYQQAVKQQQVAEQALALKERERQDDLKLRRDEMAAREAERKQTQQRLDTADARKSGDLRAKAIGYGPVAESDVDTLLQSPERGGDVRYSFGPGTADGPELQPTPEQQREQVVAEAVGKMGGVVGPNGQIVMPPKPPAPDKGATIGSFEDYVTTKYGPRPTAAQIEAARRTYGDTGRAEPRGLGASLNLPGAYGTAFSRAILNAAPMKRAGLIQTANDIATGGTEDDLKSLIRQAAIEGENVDVKNQILGRQSTIKALTDAKKLITDMKAQGVPTNLLSGTFENVARKLGTTTNPQYIRLSQNLKDTLINYRRAATGAAFSDSEGKAYAEMFPGYTNDLPVNVALLDGLMEAMSSRDRAYWEYKLGSEGADLVASKPGKKNPNRDK